MRKVLVLALLGALVAAGFPAADAGTTRVVPDQYPTIQAAVDASSPGDTVWVRAGRYTEAVTIPASKTGLVLTGEGRDLTILSGEGERDRGITVRADGVTVRDLTVRQFGGSGIVFEDVQGFLVDSIDADTTGGYGVFVVRSQHGAVRNSRAWGHWDAGFYVGESLYCFCVVEDNEAFRNVGGYSGTASNYITIRRNDFHDNRLGMSLSTLPSEPGLQQFATVVDNHIHHNNFRGINALVAGVFAFPTGIGIAIAGGSHNAIVGNDVHDNELFGISVFWLFGTPLENRVTGNRAVDNGVDLWWDEYGVNNCWEGNDFRSSDPAVLPDCAQATPVSGIGNVGVPNVRKTAWLAILTLLQNGNPGDPYDTPVGPVGPLPL